LYLNGYKLEKVLKYQYLGNLIEASGKFHSTHIELSKRVVRLCFPCLNIYRSKMSSANMRQFKDSVSNVTG
jgi:hypothetical protein